MKSDKILRTRTRKLKTIDNKGNKRKTDLKKSHQNQKLQKILVLSLLLLALPIKSAIVQVPLGTYTCTPNNITPVSFDMNYKTDKGLLIGCGTGFVYKNIFPELVDITQDFNFILAPLPTSFSIQVTNICHKKKTPSGKDIVFLAFTMMINGSPQSSLVRMFPNYLDYYGIPIPSDPITSGNMNTKTFQIPDRRVNMPLQIPIVTILRSVPENNFFLAVDNLNQIHAIDTAAVDLPYPANSIYFPPLVDDPPFDSNLVTIFAMKYRELQSELVVGLSNGKARIYGYNTPNVAPVTLIHPSASAVTAIEVIKFDSRIITGSNMGNIVVWTMSNATPAVGSIVNTYSRNPTSLSQVVDISYIVATDYFLSVHSSREVCVWKFGQTTLFDFAVILTWTTRIPVNIMSIENTQEFLIGLDSSGGVIKLRSTLILCDISCDTCNGKTRFECLTCRLNLPPLGSDILIRDFERFPASALPNTNVQCKMVCQPTGEYLNQDVNKCQNCPVGCTTCSGPNRIDCLICSFPYKKHSDGSCWLSCQPGSFQSTTVVQKCDPCHSTCGDCTSGSPFHCTVCANGLFRNLDNSCSNSCGNRSYKSSLTSCSNCHQECFNCLGPLKNECTECSSPIHQFITTEGRCADCLDRHLEEPKFCNFTKGITLARCPYESKDPFSSLTLKIWFDDFDLFKQVLDKKMNWGQDLFDVKVDGLAEGQEMTPANPDEKPKNTTEVTSSASARLLQTLDRMFTQTANRELVAIQTQPISKRYLVRRDSLVIDLNFTKSLDNKKEVTVSTLVRDFVTINATNLDSFFVLPLKSSFMHYIQIKININSVYYVENLAWALNLCLLIGGLLMGIIVVIMLWKQFDVSYLLMDFTRMAKIMHRLKFINIDQTPLVEFFLSKVYNLFQSGLDRKRDEVDKFQHSYRGRLTEVGVPVFPLVNFADKFLLYLIINMAYFSYSRVARYTAVGNSKKAQQERKLMKIIGRIKIMVILIICNDLLFASFRNLLHYNWGTYSKTNQSLQYYILSSLTVIFVCFDIISIAVNISSNKILTIFQQSTRLVKINLSRKAQYLKDLEQDLIYPDGSLKRKPTEFRKYKKKNADGSEVPSAEMEDQQQISMYQSPIKQENKRIEDLQLKLDEMKQIEAVKKDENLKMSILVTNKQREQIKEKPLENQSDDEDDDEMRRKKMLLGAFSNAYGQNYKDLKHSRIGQKVLSQQKNRKNRENMINLNSNKKNNEVNQDVDNSSMGLMMDSSLINDNEENNLNKNHNDDSMLTSTLILDSNQKNEKLLFLSENATQPSKNKSKKKKGDGDDEDLGDLISQKDKNAKRFINLGDMQKSNKFTTDLEFCTKGIDAGKFMVFTPSRYFNIIVVMKTVLLEVIIISNQVVPVVQVGFLFLIQLTFWIFFMVCLFRKKIFKNNLIQYINLIFETSLLLYFIISVGEAWCKVGINLICTSVSVRRTFFFVLLIIISSVLCWYFVYTMWVIYVRVFRPKSIKSDNEIELPQDRVDVIWVDDTDVLNNKSKF